MLYTTLYSNMYGCIQNIYLFYASYIQLYTAQCTAPFAQTRPVFPGLISPAIAEEYQQVHIHGNVYIHVYIYTTCPYIHTQKSFRNPIKSDASGVSRHHGD